MSNFGSNLSLDIDWDNQAKSHMFAAMNCDGDIRLFKEEPTLEDGYWKQGDSKGSRPRGDAGNYVWPKNSLYYPMSLLKRKG